MKRLEKKGFARLYTITYCKWGHSYIHQFVAETHGELSFNSHTFLEKEQPFAIFSMDFQKVSTKDYKKGPVELFGEIR